MSHIISADREHFFDRVKISKTSTIEVYLEEGLGRGGWGSCHLALDKKLKY